MTAPEVCTSLKLIIASASRESAAARGPGAERVRARISARPPPTRTRIGGRDRPHRTDALEERGDRRRLDDVGVDGQDRQVGRRRRPERRGPTPPPSPGRPARRSRQAARPAAASSAKRAGRRGALREREAGKARGGPAGHRDVPGAAQRPLVGRRGGDRGGGARGGRTEGPRPARARLPTRGRWPRWRRRRRSWRLRPGRRSRGAARMGRRRGRRRRGPAFEPALDRASVDLGLQADGVDAVRLPLFERPIAPDEAAGLGLDGPDRLGLRGARRGIGEVVDRRGRRPAGWRPRARAHGRRRRSRPRPAPARS